MILPTYIINCSNAIIGELGHGVLLSDMLRDGIPERYTAEAGDYWGRGYIPAHGWFPASMVNETWHMMVAAAANSVK